MIRMTAPVRREDFDLRPRHDSKSYLYMAADRKIPCKRVLASVLTIDTNLDFPFFMQEV